MQKEDQFAGLLENAFDFLEKATASLSSAPKYSIIHFHAAIELFLKARLFAEHWSLVVAKNTEPDWTSFTQGNFQSVTYQDAILRLRKIVRLQVSDEMSKSIESLSRHRNRIVHFYHPAVSEAATKNLRTEVVKEELRCWYHMYQFLTGESKKIFRKWTPRIEDVNFRFKQKRDFLRIIFDNSQNEIANLKARGQLFKECPSCDFLALPYKPGSSTVQANKCLVCEVVESSITIECPKCTKPVVFLNEGSAICPNCKRHLIPSDLAAALTDSAEAFIAAKEGLDSYDLGSCIYCDGFETVVKSKIDGKYICTNCLEVSLSLERCEWCNAASNGDMSDTSIFGCSECGGSKNYD